MFVAVERGEVHFIKYEYTSQCTKLLLFKRAMNIERFCLEIYNANAFIYSG